MDKSSPPLSLAGALALPLPQGRRSSEVLIDGDLEIRFYALKGHDPQPPHNRDEIYIVAAGRGKVRVGDRVDPIEPGGLIFVAPHEVHRFEDFSDDFVASLALLKEILPEVSRVALLGNPANPASPQLVRHAHDAARTLGVLLQPLEARSSSEIESTLTAITRG